VTAAAQGLRSSGPGIGTGPYQVWEIGSAIPRHREQVVRKSVWAGIEQFECIRNPVNGVRTRQVLSCAHCDHRAISTKTSDSILRNCPAFVHEF